MGYEHRLRNYLIGHTNVNPKFDGFELLKSLDELKEVYAKAKAWDNYIAEIERDIRTISDNEEEIKWHVDYAINEYMEDK